MVLMMLIKDSLVYSLAEINLQIKNCFKFRDFDESIIYDFPFHPVYLQYKFGLKVSVIQNKLFSLKVLPFTYRFLAIQASSNSWRYLLTLLESFKIQTIFFGIMCSGTLSYIYLYQMKISMFQQINYFTINSLTFIMSSSV